MNRVWIELNCAGGKLRSTLKRASAYVKNNVTLEDRTNVGWAMIEPLNETGG